jgi:hypothetical protein
MRGCPKRCPHNHHSDHQVGELALYGHDDLVPWIDEVQQVDWYDHATRSLSSSSHLSLPLSERDIILIGAFANHLLSGTTHLKDKSLLHKMDVSKMKKNGLIQGRDALVSTPSVLPTQGRYYRWGPTQSTIPRIREFFPTKRYEIMAK